MSEATSRGSATRGAYLLLGRGIHRVLERLHLRAGLLHLDHVGIELFRDRVDIGDLVSCDRALGPGGLVRLMSGLGERMSEVLVPLLQALGSLDLRTCRRVGEDKLSTCSAAPARATTRILIGCTYLIVDEQLRSNLLHSVRIEVGLGLLGEAQQALHVLLGLLHLI